MENGHGTISACSVTDFAEVLQVQIKAASATGCFVFTHRVVDATGAEALLSYLQECRAKFVDLSSLGGWNHVSLGIAEVLQYGLRHTRSLVLDGNCLGSDQESFSRLCSALRDHPGLQHISMRNTGLDDRSACHLADGLRRHSVLFEVDLGLNPIGDAGVSALADAVGDSYVIVAVDLGGCNASEESLAGLAAVLQSNADSFRARGGRAVQLQDVRRARAQAVTAVAQFGATVSASRMPASSIHSLDAKVDAVNPVSTATLSSRTRVAAPADKDVVFFDAQADAPIFMEVLERVDAGWRYTAEERELLIEMRRHIEYLMAYRMQERHRFEDLNDQLGCMQASAQEHLRAAEDRILRLREDLPLEVEITKCILQRRLSDSVLLEAEQAETGLALEATTDLELNTKRLENGLRMRNTEIREQTKEMQGQLERLEQELAAGEAEAVRSWRLLHAARFETENERFVSQATQEAAVSILRKAQEEAALRMMAARAEVAA